MSIGPISKKEQFELSRFERIRYAVKIATETYFREPLYYLFYSLLAAVGMGLLFSINFPWQLWAMLGALGTTQIVWPKTPTEKKK